ncbi:MAG TPA: hypothetical protein VIM56_16975 [Rhizomicrobium sp.]
MPVPDFAHGVTSASYWMTHLKSVQTKTAAKTDATQTASASNSATPPSTKTADTDSGHSFWGDVLDVVNPLQHLPVVGTVYRAITGDQIGDVEKVAGDTLYGGPIGLVSSLADVAFEKITGKDFGSTVMAFVGLDHSDSTTALAANTPKTEAAKSMAVASKEATAAPIQLASTMKPRIVPAALPTVAQPAPPKPVTSQSAPTATPASSVVDISANTDALLQALARNGVTGDMQAQALDAYKRTMNMNSAAIAPTLH